MKMHTSHSVFFVALFVINITLLTLPNCTYGTDTSGFGQQANVDNQLITGEGVIEPDATGHQRGFPILNSEARHKDCSAGSRAKVGKPSGFYGSFNVSGDI